jgi:hypothetical protein
MEPARTDRAGSCGTSGPFGSLAPLGQGQAQRGDHVEVDHVPALAVPANRRPRVLMQCQVLRVVDRDFIPVRQPDQEGSERPPLPPFPQLPDVHLHLQAPAWLPGEPGASLDRPRPLNHSTSRVYHESSPVGERGISHTDNARSFFRTVFPNGPPRPHPPPRPGEPLAAAGPDPTATHRPEPRHPGPAEGWDSAVGLSQGTRLRSIGSAARMRCSPAGNAGTIMQCRTDEGRRNRYEDHRAGSAR